MMIRVCTVSHVSASFGGISLQKIILLNFLLDYRNIFGVRKFRTFTMQSKD